MSVGPAGVDLDQAIYGLLAPARLVIDRHGNDGAHTCRSCRSSWPCFELGTAIGALDLVLRVHVAARHQPDSRPVPPGRPGGPARWPPGSDTLASAEPTRQAHAAH